MSDRDKWRYNGTCEYIYDTPVDNIIENYDYVGTFEDSWGKIIMWISICLIVCYFMP